MTRELVFVHGRAQQHKDAATLKAAWIDAWVQGLSKSGLSMPVTEQQIGFPYYGDTLAELASGKADDEIAEVIVRGNDLNDEEMEFIASVLEEVRVARGVTDEQVIAATRAEVIERGWRDWRWVRGIVKALDQHLPGASAATIELVTYDVYHYLMNPGVRDAIETGVRAAMNPDVETVVIGHSLGTVVAYNMLKRDGSALRWDVPLLVTLGSPLAVTAIRHALRPIGHPSCASAWFNAMDSRDLVALYPLEAPRFDVRPPIENKTDVRNDSANRHGIAGYLSDAAVARRIYDALSAP